MRVTTLLCVAAALVVSHTAPAATTVLSPSPTTPSAPTATPTICFESVGGCCDFGGRRPCYQLEYGQDESRCRYGDGGNPVGCNFNVICNASTGLCEAAVPMPTPTPTPTSGMPPCVGDCNGDGRVTVDEILTAINIALGNTPLSACPGADCSCAAQICVVGVDCILEAVDNALNGCPGLRTPTATPTPSPVPPQTPTPTSCQPEPPPTPTIPGSGVILGTAQGAPGTEVVIEARLRSVERFPGIAAVANDFAYDTSKISVPATQVCKETPAMPCTTDADCNGDICIDVPDCQASATLQKEASTFGFLPLGCSGTDCRGVRASVFSVVSPSRLIPDGAIVYTCKIDIAAGATGEAALSAGNVEVSCPSPPDSCTAPVTGVDGRVVICMPTATPLPPGICGNVFGSDCFFVCSDQLWRYGICENPIDGRYTCASECHIPTLTPTPTGATVTPVAPCDSCCCPDSTYPVCSADGRCVGCCTHWYGCTYSQCGVFPTATPTCVPFPSLTPRFWFTLEPNLPRVGEHATLSIKIDGGAPHGVYHLLATSDLVEGLSPTYVVPEGSEVDFDLNPIQSGTTDLVLEVFYTIDLPSPVYCYASRYQDVQSEPFPITVVPAGN
jgi:hypothetical protein